jgi:hypothetical protein
MQDKTTATVPTTNIRVAWTPSSPFNPLNDKMYKTQVPYFPVDNARVIYTKMFSKREKTTVRVIHKVRVMQLKSKKFQNT